MFFRRMMHRLHERRLRRRREQELAELGEAGSVMAYLDDQIAVLDVTITARHAELEGMVHTRTILAVRRDALDETRNQAMALYSRA
jgi:hypothetical protein